jgi:hypothetical protein
MTTTRFRRAFEHDRQLAAVAGATGTVSFDIRPDLCQAGASFCHDTPMNELLDN